MKAPRPLVVLLLLVALVAGCGGAPSPAGDAAPPPSGERPAGTAVGYRAPGFSLSPVEGGAAVSLESLRGKVVVVSFWASWCGPCRREIPELEAVWKSVKDQDAVLVGISQDEASSDAQSFLGMFPVTYPMLWDQGGKVGAEWGVGSLPTTVVLDRAGVVRQRHLGYTPRQVKALRGEIEALLKESSEG